MRKQTFKIYLKKKIKDSITRGSYPTRGQAACGTTHCYDHTPQAWLVLG